MFALQNALTSGKSLLRWSPHARHGLNLGPSPMHARNDYLVLNLITGYVSPQYHCCSDDFFETTRYGGPDVSSTISWQQIVGLDRARMILSEMSTPIQRSVMYPETPSEGDVLLEEYPFSPPVFDVTLDKYSVTDGDSQVSENSKPSRQSRLLFTLATGSALCTMAICPTQRRSPPQQSASAGGWHIETRAFQLNLC